MQYRAWKRFACLYVEGVTASYPQCVTLSLTCANGPVGIQQDIVSFTVIDPVLRHSTGVLDDWPGETDKLRSPKYIFGEYDPISVWVSNLGINPGEIEHLNSFVKVTSESDAVGVNLTLRETSEYSQSFTNIEEDGELLYLAEASSEGTKDKIKVVDEEVLTFWMQIQPGSDNYVSCKTVMVDRGEVAAVDGTPTLDAGEFHDDMRTAYDWFSDGLYDKNHEKASGTDAKCVELGNKVDMMYVAGHCSSGDSPTRIYAVDSTYGLKEHGSANNLQVADVGTWARELDWLILACCSTCKIDFPAMTGPGTEWVGTMDDGGVTHAIMGYRYGAPGGSTPTTDVQLADEFVSNLANRSVKNAWIDTNYTHKWATWNHVYSPLYAVAIFRNVNVDDRIGSLRWQQITRDSDEDNFTYYQIYWQGSDDPADCYVDQDSVHKEQISYIP